MPQKSTPFEITDPLLDAIAKWEGRGRIDPHAIGDRKLANKAYGAWQMRLPALQDVQAAYPEYRDVILPDTLGNLALQRALAKAYLQLLQDRYGMKGFDQTVGAYNAGSGNIKKGRYPTQYLEGVRGYMEAAP